MTTKQKVLDKLTEAKAAVVKAIALINEASTLLYDGEEALLCFAEEPRHAAVALNAEINNFIQALDNAV